MGAPLICSDIINHERYPIDLADDPRRQTAVERVRAELATDGCAVIRDFFSEAGLAALVDEAEARKPQAYYSPSKYNNVYLNDGNPDLPPEHPLNVLMPRTNGFVTSDLFGEEARQTRMARVAESRAPYSAQAETGGVAPCGEVRSCAGCPMYGAPGHPGSDVGGRMAA